MLNRLEAADGRPYCHPIHGVRVESSRARSAIPTSIAAASTAPRSLIIRPVHRLDATPTAASICALRKPYAGSIVSTSRRSAPARRPRAAAPEPDEQHRVDRCPIAQIRRPIATADRFGERDPLLAR